MKKKIDDNFIKKGQNNYDENDENEYEEIKKLVKEDIKKNETISFPSFEKLYKWKTRGRSFHNVEMKDYNELYSVNIKIALNLPDNKKIYMLNGLPGIGIPVASTLLHFIYPDTFPIIDERTIIALQYFEYLDKNKSVYQLRDSSEAYNRYRNEILKIQKKCKESWNLREIDQALFAFEKKELSDVN